MSSSQKQALIIMLHGSPHEEANAPAYALAETLRQQRRFAKVIVAFMECNEPSIPEAIEQCAETDTSVVIALPWFLHAGRHLVLDVSALLVEAQKKHLQLTVLLTDPIGTSPLVADALAVRAEAAIPISF